MLKSDKVILRPMRKSDLTLLQKWFNDPDVGEYLGWYLPMTEVMLEKWLEDALSTKDGTFVAFVIEAAEKHSSTPIGTIGFSHIDYRSRNAMMGISIGEKDYWKKGFGTEVVRLLVKYGFEQLNLHRIDSYVFAPNTRSLRLHTKAGFIEDGSKRAVYFKNGRFLDEVMFGLLKEE